MSKTVETVRTPHGDLPANLLTEYMRASGNVYRDNDWVIQYDYMEYFQLVDPASRDDGKKWKKKLGNLTARDYNFTYAACKTAKIITTEDGRRAIEYDPVAALRYVKNKLLRDGKPVYLPEMLAAFQDPTRDTDEKPPKSYSKILDEVEQELNDKLNYGSY